MCGPLAHQSMSRSVQEAHDCNTQTQQSSTGFCEAPLRADRRKQVIQKCQGAVFSEIALGAIGGNARRRMAPNWSNAMVTCKGHVPTSNGAAVFLQHACTSVVSFCLGCIIAAPVSLTPCFTHETKHNTDSRPRQSPLPRKQPMYSPTQFSESAYVCVLGFSLPPA